MVQIKRVVLIGGPSASGKSVLIAMLQHGLPPDLCDQLGIDPDSSPIYIGMGRLSKQNPSSSIDLLVIHYDLLHQSLPGGDFAHIPDLIGRSDSIQILTLCTPPDLLRKRIAARMHNKPYKLISFLKNPYSYKILLKRWEKKRYYKRASNILSLYDRWFAYIDKQGITNHLILDSTGPDISTVAVPYNRSEAEKMLSMEAVQPDRLNIDGKARLT